MYSQLQTVGLVCIVAVIAQKTVKTVEKKIVLIQVNKQNVFVYE